MAENQEKSTLGGVEALGTSDVEARRAFLKGCAKYAAAMPPAVTLLLSASPASSQNANCSVVCANPPDVEPPCDCPKLPLGGDSSLLSPEEIEYLQN